MYNYWTVTNFLWNMAMHLSNLRLKNFRNYKELGVDCFLYKIYSSRLLLNGVKLGLRSMEDTFKRGPPLLLSGRANRSLAGEIGQILGQESESATITDFADGEIFVRINQNARGRF